MQSDCKTTILPVISTSVKSELANQKMSLSPAGVKKIETAVAIELDSRILSDPQFQAIQNRLVYRGNKDDVRGYNMSDRARKAIVAAANARAEKLMTTVTREVIRGLADFRTACCDIGKARGGNRRRRETGSTGGGKPNAEDVFADKSKSVGDALDAILPN